MKQIIFVRGADVWENLEDFEMYLKQRPYDPYEPERERRRERLKTVLPENIEMIQMKTPCADNAHYSTRKIMFEKLIPFLKEEIILIGYSMGSTFLLKYLLENPFPKEKIRQLHFVGPFIQKTVEWAIGDFEFSTDQIPTLGNDIKNIFIRSSTDDPICPYEQAEKLASYLPQAQLTTFADRGHFFQPEFPEILEKIKECR